MNTVENFNYQHDSDINSLLNQLLDILEMSLGVYERLIISTHSASSKTLYELIRGSRNKLVEEIQSLMNKAKIKIDKRTNASTRNAFPDRNAKLNRLTSLKSLEESLLIKYKEVVHHPYCPALMKIIITNHKLQILKDVKQLVRELNLLKK